MPRIAREVGETLAINEAALMSALREAEVRERLETALLKQIIVRLESGKKQKGLQQKQTTPLTQEEDGSRPAWRARLK